jgi:hypothetical protein
MTLQSIRGWQDHFEAGRKYFKAACNGRGRPAVFNNELIFQLAAMAVERMMVGICQFHRQMPVDHTLSGLVEALQAVSPLDDELAGRIRRIERIDDMCTLSPARRRPPGREEIREILAVGDRLLQFAAEHLPRCEAA